MDEQYEKLELSYWHQQYERMVSRATEWLRLLRKQ